MLTPREERVYMVIKDHYLKTDKPLRPFEIADAIGYKSTGGISRIITSLQSYGLVERRGKNSRARSIHLVPGASLEDVVKEQIVEKPLIPISTKEKRARVRSALGFYNDYYGF